MKIFKAILLSVFIAVHAHSLNIDDKTNFYDLLPNSKIFIDKSKNLTIEDIKTKDKEFKQNDKSLLGFGYSPDFSVWVKFTLKNTTNKTIYKTVEYDNALTSEVLFFDLSTNRVFKEGLLNMRQGRKTINPTFNISLKPNESKTYYIRASSYITTLIVKLNLWESNCFYEKEIRHQLILALFFGSMFILALYNLFIFFFTKDISYLYYVLYILGVIVHHLLYVGVAFIYLLQQSWFIYIVEMASVFAVVPILALGLFTKSFLNIKQYPKLNKILNGFLILIPLTTVVFIISDGLDKYRNILSLGLLLYLIYLTIYGVVKKNRQAYFILAGWSIISIAVFLMFLSSTGIFNFYKYFPYIVETAFVLEAIIFSIALADRINVLQREKNIANKRLITQQQNEKERLEATVTEKTKDLKKALDEKGLLLKELNHRVKNNMQTIVSLIRLQSDEIEDERYQDIFETIQNRINAMSHLHELLYKQDNISNVNAYDYFDLVSQEIKESYDNDVEINFDIRCELKMEQAVYCGLILNELITNSFKYAFVDGKGNIDIKLTKDKELFKLSVSDDGIGYSKDIPSDSLGLVLVNTLAKKQLKGDINIDSSEGVKVEIKWSK